MFLHNKKNNSYEFTTEHVAELAEQLAKQGSHWNETQLNILLEAITYPIEESIKICNKHNDLTRCIYILSSLKKVNSNQDEDLTFDNYLMNLGEHQGDPCWLSNLFDTLSILYRLCLGSISEIALELNLRSLQKSHFVTQEQKQEVQKIIDDQLTLVLDVIAKNKETPTPNLSDNNFFDNQQRFFSNSPINAQSKIEFKTQETKPLPLLPLAAEVMSKPTKIKNKHSKHQKKSNKSLHKGPSSLSCVTGSGGK